MKGLHPELGPGGWWWACDHPERPVDGMVGWLWSCDACMMHLVASARYWPSDFAEENHPNGTRSCTNIASTLTAARTWRAGNGLVAL